MASFELQRLSIQQWSEMLLAFEFEMARCQCRGNKSVHWRPKQRGILFAHKPILVRSLFVEELSNAQNRATQPLHCYSIAVLY